ncbi:hypothetical protein EN35_14490 [Rhodococcus qingshengii]|nr:hypothetical protein EN35_14490 [Rhodococcus qingshengii]
MTIISEPLQDPAGRPETEPLVFYIETVRQNVSGTGTVSVKRVDVTPVGGVLTTPNLDPGPAQVQWRGQRYPIVIPHSVSSVRLWPLLDAGMPHPPSTAAGFVRNGGGVTRIQALTQIEYENLDSPDPATLFIITDSQVT